MSEITPSMGLTNPDPLVTAGPQYASDISTDLDIIDSHNHSPSNGAPIPSAALNINADISFNGFSLTDVGVTAYQSAVTAPGNINATSVQAGELVYRDANGALVVITNNGSIAGATGTIQGLVPPASATYSSITETLVISSDTNEAAKLAISDIIQYKFNDTSGANLTHKWAPASPTSYVLQYPDVAPLTNDSVAKTTTAGVQTFDAFGIVPVGGIIAIASNLSGSFPIPTTGTSSRGWQLCDGAAVEGGGTLSGNVPTLNDSRFLMGSAIAGTPGGANSIQTNMQNHTHAFPHVHKWSAINNAGAVHASSVPSSGSITIPVSPSNTTLFGSNFSVASGSTDTVGVFNNSSLTWYTMGAEDAPTGSGSSVQTGVPSNNLTDFWDNRPLYLSSIYLIRIK